MSSHFAKVWKATGYCRTNGVLVAADYNRRIWLPVERLVSAATKTLVGVHDGRWTALNPDQQDWVDQARLMATELGVGPDVKASFTFRYDGGRNSGLHVGRAASIAAVRAVCAAIEHPAHPAAMTAAEGSLDWTSGLAWGSAGVASTGAYEVLGTERYIWVYAHPASEPNLAGEFADVDAVINAKGTLAERLSQVKASPNHAGEGLREFALEAGLTPLAVVGGLGPEHPAALLLERDHLLTPQAQVVCIRLREHLGPDWTVGISQSAVPTS